MATQQLRESKLVLTNAALPRWRASDPVTSKPRRGHNAIPQLHNALEHNGPDKSHDGETAQSVQRGDEQRNQTNDQ